MHNVHNSQAACFKPKMKMKKKKTNKSFIIVYDLPVNSMALVNQKTIQFDTAAAKKTTIVEAVPALMSRKQIEYFEAFNSIQFEEIFFHFVFVIIICDSIDNNNRFNQSRKVIDIWREKKKHQIIRHGASGMSGILGHE